MLSIMEAYYRARAGEYGRFYENPLRLDELNQLREWVASRVRGLNVLEIAAGTGYWTEVAAPVASAVTAIDSVPETLALAAQRPLGPRVTLLAADAYHLPEFAGPFEAGMAHMWWSHVEKERQANFLSQFVARLKPGAAILMIDQNFVEGICGPTSRRDQWGNQYEMRTLSDGSTYEIVKNYPTDEELRASLAPFAENIQIKRIVNFWAVSAQTRTRQS